MSTLANMLPGNQPIGIQKSTDKTTNQSYVWVQFEDPLAPAESYPAREAKESHGWVKDTDDKLLEIDEKIIDLNSRVGSGSLNQNEAVTMFKTLYKAWVDRKHELVPTFIEVKITGVNSGLDVASVVGSIIKFFTDLPSFTVGYRFLNTMKLTLKNEGHEGVKSFVYNYFNLQGRGAAMELFIPKLDSDEFKEIESQLMLVPMTKQINKRLKIYYGAPGTGKTTLAMAESENRCIVCHSSMLPDDLMGDFKFIDGKPAFTPTALVIAMQEGKTIMLDEINLLTFEAIRFLQGVLDDKPSFIYKGQTIEIKPGFQVIGTMNLNLGDQVFGLTEPLVDRAYALKEFKLTPEMLAESF